MRVSAAVHRDSIVTDSDRCEEDSVGAVLNVLHGARPGARTERTCVYTRPTTHHMVPKSVHKLDEDAAWEVGQGWPLAINLHNRAACNGLGGRDGEWKWGAAHVGAAEGDVDLREGLRKAGGLTCEKG